MYRKTMRVVMTAVMIAVLAMSFVSVSAATKLSEVRGTNGMVAAASKYAAEAGVEILKKGGNAIDAAVATAFAIGVVEPNASGLGGEGYVVAYLADQKKAIAIDYRSAAPKLTAEKYAGKSFSGVKGWDLVATPGLVLGLCTLQEKYGTLSLPEVMWPAIRLAEKGFAITAYLAQSITDSLAVVKANPDLAKVYLDPMGLPKEEGEILTNPDLAKSLRLIAVKGPDVFYHGELADAIEAASIAQGGLLRKSDLEAYVVYEREPLSGTYRGNHFYTAPPPVGGIILSEALSIMENFDLSARPLLDPYNVHIIAEALKRSFADHYQYCGDPAFVNVPLKELQNKDYAKFRSWTINPSKMTPLSEIKYGNPMEFSEATVVDMAAAGYESPSTTHISVMDKNRNTVALTQTLSSFFGAGVTVPGTGIILNNENANFALAPNINSIAPNKRMRTTIVPTIMVDEKDMPILSIGTPGAGRIAPALTQIIHAIIDQKMGLQEAIEAPRFHVVNSSITFEYESRMPAATLEGLKAKGYTIDPKNMKGEYDLYFGGAQGVYFDAKTGEFVGAADPRRDGAARGF
ncbi:MAG TPA: gamma-glutamyltransferase [Bacillota bacterium]|nr:gamma-glutamyltransferase [Bacillota bacterium]HOA15067.1 gamma-glutamyltransferase [Bacillota bacterium]HOG52886.1 gamma-glutamyltransferase [Bacillota bacterium]